MKLRIVTYNIHKGVSTIGARPRIHAIKQALTGLSADVVFFQEVQGGHDLLALSLTTFIKALVRLERDRASMLSSRR